MAYHQNTLQHVLSNPKMVYTKPLKVKVVAVGRKKNFQNQKGQDQSMWVLGLADDTTSAKALLYDEEKLQVMKEGRSVMLLNFSAKASHLSISTSTIAGRASNVLVPEDIESAARRIVHPPETPKMTVDQVKKSPIKALATIQGQIIKDDLVQTVSVKGQPVVVRNLTVKGFGEDHEIKVALWRDLSGSEIKAGDFVEMNSFLVTTFSNEVSLASTDHSAVRKCDVPENELEVVLIGFSRNNNSYTLMIDTDDDANNVLRCTSPVFTRAFHDLSEDDLANKLPIRCTLMAKGNICSNIVPSDLF